MVTELYMSPFTGQQRVENYPPNELEDTIKEYHILAMLNNPPLYSPPPHTKLLYTLYINICRGYYVHAPLFSFYSGNNNRLLWPPGALCD